ncbi:MAG: hypothetical protein CR967_01220 [Proteobacteria bacterium]|nr:MAG: hypothetical protein CR967_01220 [Pseudomonadota bacterium]
MILITGKSGFLASQLIRVITKRIRSVQIKCTSREKNTDSVFLDLNDISSFDFSIINDGDLIVHMAAISSPDICESFYTQAFVVNVTNTIKFIDGCINRGAKVLFYSSDTVFGEQSNQFYEDAELAPLGKYAEMKAIVESYYTTNDKVKIFHLSYVFSSKDKFMQYLIDCYKNDLVAEVFASLERSVIYIADVIDATIHILQRWNTLGIKSVNLAGPDLISRELITKYFAIYADAPFKYKVISPPSDFFSSRPKIINMKSKYLYELLGRQPMSLKKAMSFELKGRL